MLDVTRSTIPAARQSPATLAPGSVYYLVAVAAPQLRQGAPVALLALLVAVPVPAPRKVVETTGYCPGDLLRTVA